MLSIEKMRVRLTVKTSIEFHSLNELKAWSESNDVYGLVGFKDEIDFVIKHEVPIVVQSQNRRAPGSPRVETVIEMEKYAHRGDI